MKKLLPILFLSLAVLSGCNSGNSKTTLSFGTYGVEEAQELTDIDVEKKIFNENCLLATYTYQTTCDCWRTFNKVINEAVKTYHLQVYYVSHIYITTNMQEIGITRSASPDFYIINKGKVAKRYTYGDKDTSLFKTIDGFMKHIDNNCILPSMYYTTKEYLDNELTTKTNENIYTFFMRGDCGDCKKVIPNVLVPYFTTHCAKILTLDIDQYRGTEQYQTIKDQYHLSNTYDQKYGYGQGVVPTLQVWKNNEVIDACVYLNDEYNTDNFTITNSFYTANRAANLHYLGGFSADAYNLVGKVIPEQYRENYTKMSEYTEILHSPLINAYLNYYFSNSVR